MTSSPKNPPKQKKKQTHTIKSCKIQARIQHDWTDVSEPCKGFVKDRGRKLAVDLRVGKGTKKVLRKEMADTVHDLSQVCGYHDHVGHARGGLLEPVNRGSVDPLQQGLPLR